MLILNEENLLKLVSSEMMNGLMDTIASSMTSSTTTPLRTTVSRGGNSFMLMPSLADDYWGLKVLTLYPDNPKIGKAFINGVVLLVRAPDGVPVALFNGSILTALRTGAVGGLGVRTLARRDVSKIGLIGAGVQGYWQLRFACTARKFDEIWIYDIDTELLPGYVDRLSELEIPVRMVGGIPELIKNCDVILSATNSKKPIFDGDTNLFSQKLFVGIGSYKPEMREFPDEIFAHADGVYVDTLHALDETGDLIFPIANGYIKKEKIRPLSEMFSTAPRGGMPRRGTFVYKSVGGAEFDLFAAKKIFELALKNGLGMEVNL